MTLYQRGKVWWVEFQKNGKRHRQSCGTTNEREAKRFVKGLNLATKLPGFEKAVEFLRLYFEEADADRIPLSSAWTKYADIAKATGRGEGEVVAKTWRMREERLNRFIKWCGDMRPNATNIEDIGGTIAAAFAAHLAQSKNSKGEKLSTKTRGNIIGDLSGIWRMLEKVSDRIHNPWDGLIPRDTDGKRRDAFTDDQADAVMVAAEKVGKGWPLACLIARHTGLRYGDIATLTWESVDFAANTIRTTPNKTKKHGITVVVPMVDRLAEAMRKAHADAIASRSGSAKSEFVLPEHALLYGDKGRGAFDALNFREVLAAAEIGGGDFTFHSWRHYFRSKLAEGKVSTETAMRLCGHTDERTSRRYDHDDHLDELREAVSTTAL